MASGTVQNKRNYITSIVIIGGLFFTFGFVSWVNAILIPYFKICCELTHFQAYLVAFAFYIAYLVFSIPGSMILNRVGFKKGISYGLWLLALGAAAFIPAALTRTYGIFLTGLFIMGSGLAVLQTAANAYITIIGPIDSAAKRISIMGICNKFAGIISPLIFAAVVLRASDSQLFADLDANVITGLERTAVLDELVGRVIVPYLGLALILFLFGMFIRRSSLPEIKPGKSDDPGHAAAAKKSVLQYPYLIMGAVAIFFHAGSQVLAIDTIIGYAESLGVDLIEAKVFPSYTLACTMIGYCFGIILIPQVLSQKRALQICTSLGLVFTLLLLFVSGRSNILGHDMDISIWFLVLMGLPNSLIYANIWPLAIRDLGPYTNRGSSLLVMGLCGNAFLPVFYGMLADSCDVRTAYWILVPCFLYLIFFAFKGYSINSWNRERS